MEVDPYVIAPCSSLAVSSIVNVGTAGAIWGLCSAPHDAHKFGLTGIKRAGFVANSVARCTFQCALIAGISTSVHCGVQRYRGKDDWVNGLVAGAMAGGAIAALSRSWKQVIPTACLVSALKIAADYGRKNVNTS
ncbi:Mitochondrial inner membrane translocase subunit Tim17/Tim22/Tim23/peroxisomal protein PMP24 [Rosa chinensis]|uniref:Mitochondrial inner membrane translocase subunit Tim17/Tim22/Tim23/peroxisomal protein PMP24 n=1 Tax=Rosa chinensis TaxID=74649 RepID=A0A2P6PWS8_ROSCH|nr:outer envelope pore protein 16-4, chloroplastic [Rosa chinensis]PRQ26387.1 Mitochondrial inner membrane translocase subunit Tim17/Tim22/Tim23/peroxisomal protein PMP24 [Rosa chinensis]